MTILATCYAALFWIQIPVQHCLVAVCWSGAGARVHAAILVLLSNQELTASSGFRQPASDDVQSSARRPLRVPTLATSWEAKEGWDSRDTSFSPRQKWRQVGRARSKVLNCWKVLCCNFRSWDGDQWYLFVLTYVAVAYWYTFLFCRSWRSVLAGYLWTRCQNSAYQR